MSTKIRRTVTRRWSSIVAAGLAFAGVTCITPAQGVHAHETGSAGDLEIVFGWEHEPTYSGVPNAVHVTVRDTAGEPVDDQTARLTVTVTYGDLAITRPLTPLPAPGEYAAFLVPTEPGVYAFQLMGSIAGETVDLSSTCSDTTFDCVVDAVEVRFPGAGAPDDPTTASPVVTVPAHADSSVGIVPIAALALATLACIGVGLVGFGAWRPRRPR